ncbi:diacylglycerol O-acyltransferase 1 [Vermiconidia calcicola]|uniref:Diacylglycerol O-acyltransferase 1 n=1 Tax=Vermiconidia calcicola TaxID=1690605 RepID=A0ACC3N961_9PEZI|nr:diacylglycerol O-acyltransferase 1 [Vermiconidia calcicola]
MAATLNAEPADPNERIEHALPPKSYADAVEEDPRPEVEDDEKTLIDEDAIKESPPRPQTMRNSSELRAFGEVMDEVEAKETHGSPGSRRAPSPGVLRHPKGRLEEEIDLGTRKSSAVGAVKAGLWEGVNGNANGAANGDKTPETLEGVGEDEEPRTPVRKVHRRSWSKSLDDTASAWNNKDGNGSLSSLSPSSSQLSPKSLGVENAVDSIYENVYNKSGENLATLKPADGYYTSLTQRENKPSNPEPRPSRDRSNSELVSGRRAGAGWSRSKIRWAPFNVPIQRRLQTAIVLMHTLSIAGLFALFFLLCTIPLLWPILLPYLIYVLLSRAAIDGQLSQRSERARNLKIWSLFASYFPARLHRSAKLEPTRKYIFGYHPHGIISHGAFAAFGTEALGFKQLFPGITNVLLTLDSNFRIPLYRDYALRMGLASVSRESCENILSHGGPNGEGMGRAITIVVGGARESLEAKPYSLKLVVKRRKGFVKLAIRQGADLVPVLAFGENDIYDQVDTDRHPWIHGLQMAVKKVAGFTVPLFHARGVFNYDVGLMPYRRPINIVVGRPIEVLQNKNPDPGYVDEIHEKYVEELLRIWEEWKDTFARGRRGELEIIE